MVPIINEPINRSTDIDLLQRNSLPIVTSPNTPTSQSTVETARLQYFQTRNKDKGFSDKTINLLSSSVDNRSSRTVSSAIRVWEHWCDSQHIDPVTCPINKICEFFSDMLTFGKSYNTIAGYRSAISEMHERIDNFSIGTHPDILKAMQAIRINKPPTSKSDDAIDIIPSLEFIVSLGDNSTMSIRELTCKTAFLLALISACRPSDLHQINAFDYTKTRSSISFNCVAPKEYNIAVAHSASTTKSRLKKIFVGVYPDERHLCPYEAVTSLLSRTSLWRVSADQKRALFLITKEPHSPASVDTIAGWIKSILKISSPGSTAKDMRVLAAFFAQNAGAGLETVLALGNWSSNSVYHRFYQRGIKLMLERNQVSSLILSEARVGHDSLDEVINDSPQ
ncbi:hypothetical protein GLOIN_2v1786700 [Rhizophagus irregularis DAOM 181602=DAOM 197198]|nr:hypothetical protein GLOIN_2v1786700 [Rhizophagus irregularis DAOM 181602=DAOM 197198]